MNINERKIIKQEAANRFKFEKCIEETENYIENFKRIFDIMNISYILDYKNINENKFVLNKINQSYINIFNSCIEIIKLIIFIEDEDFYNEEKDDLTNSEIINKVCSILNMESRDWIKAMNLKDNLYINGFSYIPLKIKNENSGDDEDIKIKLFYYLKLFETFVEYVAYKYRYL